MFVLGQIAFEMLVLDCGLLHYLKNDKMASDLSVCAFLSNKAKIRV